MKVKAKWTGCGFAHCVGEWKLYIDGKDVTNKNPRSPTHRTYEYI